MITAASKSQYLHSEHMEYIAVEEPRSNHTKYTELNWIELNWIYGHLKYNGIETLLYVET